MKLYNAPQIKAEDFPSEHQQTVEMLGNALNPFLQQVYELSEGRIDFENTVQTIKTMEVTVDSNGKPTLNDKLQTGKSGIRGFHVINALSIDNNTVTALEQPFIAKYTILGNGLVQITKITGLPSDVKFQLTIVIY